MRVTIKNPEYVAQIKKQLRHDGSDSLHILSDFDRTLTYGTVDGMKTPSIISILRDGNHLAEGYAEKAHALFNIYHPVEVDANISLKEKKKAMAEWWEAHNKLLIASELSYADLEDIVHRGHVRFRDGVSEWLDVLNFYGIPLVVFSASGCGDAVRMFFQKIKKDYQNIFYVTNQFNWDEHGRAISTKGPVIHSFNKDETILKEIPEIYQTIHKRKNVVLLGDSIGDIGMIEGFEYRNFLKIGLFNEGDDTLRHEYEKNFDIVLEGDGDFHEVHILTQEILKK